jgi:hypothetical protein
MAVLMIHGEPREVRLTIGDIDVAERLIVKHDGRAIMDVLGNHGALFTKSELEWLLWGAWRSKLTAAAVQKLMGEFYANGGTLYDVQAVILEALIDSGLYGKRVARDEEEDEPAENPRTVPEKPA